jgi:hypothetical protein
LDLSSPLSFQGGVSGVTPTRTSASLRRRESSTRTPSTSATIKRSPSGIPSRRNGLQMPLYSQRSHSHSLPSMTASRGGGVSFLRCSLSTRALSTALLSCDGSRLTSNALRLPLLLSQ